MRSTYVKPILHTAAFAKHGAHVSYLLVLEGGVGVLSKPEDEIGDGSVVVRREVAAWDVVKALGWVDMISTTVLRRVTSAKGAGEFLASVQVLWPDNLPDAPPHTFENDEVLRAAIFDAIIRHDDRSGHNWLALPGSSSPHHPKLVDHGYAFLPSIDAPQSSFFQDCRGDRLGGDNTEAIRRMLNEIGASQVPGLIGSASYDALVERARRLLAGGTCDYG